MAAVESGLCLRFNFSDATKIARSIRMLSAMAKVADRGVAEVMRVVKRKITG